MHLNWIDDSFTHLNAIGVAKTDLITYIVGLSIQRGTR
ncbi:hypothetical protein C7476_1416 [Phyllobacterium bourgognense]|uniref:Uncharacterized protein n=1 Tax=Phyllobacterium bourgognense TaxID=314236 RepID=A0A368YBK0_9HYPH|nr:hypothetical protein C7476_1416 [Phyllobacterium bourgognense]